MMLDIIRGVVKDKYVPGDLSDGGKEYKGSFGVYAVSYRH